MKNICLFAFSRRQLSVFERFCFDVELSDEKISSSLPIDIYTTRLGAEVVRPVFLFNCQSDL